MIGAAASTVLGANAGALAMSVFTPQPVAAALPPQLVPFVVFVLVLTATMGMLYALLQGRLSGRSALLHRLEVSGGLDVKSSGAGGVGTSRAASFASRSSSA